VEHNLKLEYASDSVHRQGEHHRLPTQVFSPVVSTAPGIPSTSSSQPPTTSSPPVGMCIPRVRAHVPKDKRWRMFVKDWEEADPARGFMIPLKEWNPEWKSDPAFAMNYHARKVIALEFIENCA